VPVEPAAIARAVVRSMAIDALRRDGASRWDSGFGFRLIRSLFRDSNAAKSFDPMAWDALLHGGPHHQGCGPFTERMRESLSTAIWFPGRPRYEGGPLAKQLTASLLRRMGADPVAA